MSVEQQSTASPQAAEEELSIQILTFLLENEVFGADIGQIQEVLEYRKVTPVPRTPEFMLGVINLRGKVVPVIDLRQQFDMALAEITVNTCIVIVEVMVDKELTSLGILADQVREVIELQGDQLSEPPRLGSRIDTRYITTLGKHDDDFVIVLNLGRIFAEEEIEEIMDSVSEQLPPSEAEDEA